MKLRKLVVAATTAAMLAFPAQLAFAEDGVDIDNPETATVGSEPMALGNTTDTWLSFPFSKTGATWATSGRTKLDDTSAYLWVTNNTMSSCRVYIDGAYSSNGPWYNQTSYWSGTSVGNYATVTGTGTFQIMNRVYENGFTWARLSGWANVSAGTLAGYWSPDSIGSFPIINA